MHYTGQLYSDCTVFDSSVERGDPFTFTLGRGEVIQGWDDGLSGMCVGEKRKLTIPSDMAYGDAGSGSEIPGGSTLGAGSLWASSFVQHCIERVHMRPIGLEQKP